MASVRPAAVAGMFYPGDPLSLAAEVGDLLGGVGDLAPRIGFPKALVVPHAGYVYSGPVAAHAYDELSPARGVAKRVVLLGPVHRGPVRGLAAPGLVSRQHRGRHVTRYRAHCARRHRHRPQGAIGGGEQGVEG
jgi:hypothetical protein